VRNLLQSKGGKQMNNIQLRNQFIKADIVMLRERLNKAQIRKDTAQANITSINRRIKAKQALLSI